MGVLVGVAKLSYLYLIPFLDRQALIRSRLLRENAGYIPEQVDYITHLYILY